MVGGELIRAGCDRRVGIIGIIGLADDVINFRLLLDIVCIVWIALIARNIVPAGVVWVIGGFLGFFCVI